jgi:ribosomal protein S27E
MVAGPSRTPLPSIATVILQILGYPTSGLIPGCGWCRAPVGYRGVATRGDKVSVRCCMPPCLSRLGSIPNPAMKLTGRAFCACQPQAPAARPATYRHRSAAGGGAAMSISVQCPGCEKTLKAKDELAGKRVKCLACGQVILVPAGQTASEKAIIPPQQKPPVPKKAEAKTPPPYMEVPGNDKDGLCSDDSCPCGSPGATIARGEGYIYVSKEVAELRKDCPTVAQAQIKIQRMQQQLGATIFAGTGVFSPILMCELGAKKRGINMDVAAADAKHWWKTGQVPIRPTPLTGDNQGYLRAGALRVSNLQQPMGDCQHEARQSGRIRTPVNDKPGFLKTIWQRLLGTYLYQNRNTDGVFLCFVEGEGWSNLGRQVLQRLAWLAPGPQPRPGPDPRGELRP